MAERNSEGRAQRSEVKQSEGMAQQSAAKKSEVQ